MKREEIEQLLADYANGEISPEGRQQLEKLFELDAALKLEAEEMTAVWVTLKALEKSEQPSAAMDKQFYAMLKTAKADERTKGGRVIQIQTSWIKTAVAIAACVAMFVIGRYTVAPIEVVKYKTLVVKQPVSNVPGVKREPVLVVRKPANTTVKSPNQISTNNNNSELARQFRSVYASERIDAVAKLSAQKNLSESDLKLLEMALKEDPNTNVRLTVINALRPLVNKENVQGVLISGLNHQADLLVQSSLVDVLIAARSTQAIPQMIALLDNENTDAMVQNKIKGSIEIFLN